MQLSAPQSQSLLLLRSYAGREDSYPNLGTIPTLDERQGPFTGVSHIYDPTSRSQTARRFAPSFLNDAHFPLIPQPWLYSPLPHSDQDGKGQQLQWRTKRCDYFLINSIFASMAR